MSVRVMAQVWEHSKHGGTELLMLLAIADFADDDGNAYPAVATLAKKGRMSPRNANLVLAALRASGELQVRQNEGPRGTNRYRVIPTGGLKRASGVKKSSGGLKPASSPPEAGFLEPLKPASDEPSLNHHEPPIEPSALVETAAAVFDQHGIQADAGQEQPAINGQQPYRVPPCPHEAIVAAYAELLPQLPQVAVLTPVRRRAMQARWREVCAEEKFDTAAEGIDFFRWVFSRVSESKFLTGRVPPSRGSDRSFRADFDWLMTPTYFVRVCEGRYLEGSKS